mgnify:CR=1 FL=1
MLHYYLATRDEPLSWADVEALPFYIFAAIIVAGLVRVWLGIDSELESALFKSVLILMMLGLRYLLFDYEQEAADQQSPAA